MIADGVIKGVQVKRGDPTDRLLHAYVAANINADIMAMYISVAPPSKEVIKMVGDAVKTKYPFIDNQTNTRIDEIDKYNKAMSMARKIFKNKGLNGA